MGAFATPAPHGAADWIGRQMEGDTHVLYLTGVWRLPNVPAIVDALRTLQLQSPGRFVVDGSRLEALDTAAGFVLLRPLAKVTGAQARSATRGFDPKHQRLLTLVRERMATTPVTRRSTHLGLVSGVGATTLRIGRLLRTHTAFVGAVALEVAQPRAPAPPASDPGRRCRSSRRCASTPSRSSRWSPSSSAW